jgi:hypothetical protein
VADLKPHRSIYWLNHQRDADPAAFDAAVHAVCETYRHAPERHEQGIHTVSRDEKTGMQALERLHPTRQTKSGLVEREEYEYERHSTVDDLRQRVLAFVEYFNATLAKPFKWTSKG